MSNRLARCTYRLSLAGLVSALAACGSDDGAANNEMSFGGSAGSPGSAGSVASAGSAGTTSGTPGVAGSSQGGSATAGASAGAGAPNGGASTAGTASGGSSSGGSAGAANGGSAGTANGGGAGTASGGAPVCTDATPPAPPADMKQTIDLTWKEMSGGFQGVTGARDAGGSIKGYPNWTIDQVMRGKGTLNFCVRWDSDSPVSSTLRDQITATLQRGVDAWFSALVGYDCFPYAKIPVKVSAWMTRNRATMQWDNDPAVIVKSDIACPEACSRYAHNAGNYTFPNCTGGFDNRYDQEVWLEESYGAPNGWAWGQHVDRAGFTDKAISGGLYHIWLHEFGHGIGFPDYYDWDVWAPGVAAPKCVMNAGAAITVTDWDKWMFKRTWTEMRALKRW